jgi:hypothetical protein
VGNAVHNFVDSNGLIQDPVQENDDRPIEGTLILPKGDTPLFPPMVELEQPEIGPIGQTLPNGFASDSPIMNLPMPGPLVEPPQNTGGWGDWIWGGVHNTLDVAGFFPGAGAIPDLINGSLHGLRGNYGDMKMSVVAALPFFGDGVKLVDKANDVRKGVGKFAVGPYNQIKGRVPGLDAHHAGQSAAMSKVVSNYDRDTAPAILVPKIGHTVKGKKGIVSRSTKGLDNARATVARDIKELRRVYPDIPNSKLQELIEMNKNLYPEMSKRVPE